MKKSMGSFLRKKNFAKKAISLLSNHTLPQIWNAAKFKGSRFTGFTSTYLRCMPLRLVLFITLRCNLTCGWCPFGSPDTPIDIPDIDEMEMDTFEYIVDRFEHVLWLELTGGEPFLHSHIFEIINYAHEHKMKIYISTNGILIHEMLDRVSHSPLSLLNISLNACDRDEFSQLHGCSEYFYDRLLLDIRTLIKKRDSYKKRLKITISYVCHKANYKNIPKMVKLAEELGVDRISFYNLIPYGIPGFLKDRCLYDDDTEVIETIRSVPSAKSNLEVIMPRLYKRAYSARRCDIPFRILTVYPKGDISPCCVIPPQKDYGNVFRDKEIWNNPAFRQKREIFVDKSLPLPDFCKTCLGLVAEWRPAYVPHRRGIR